MTKRMTRDMDFIMKTLLLLPLITATVILTGCNTFKGVGEDITGAATWSQEKMAGDGSVKKLDSDYVQNPPQFPRNSN
jgi:predicted small secreted protein